MNYGSVCSGIEAATVAWHPLGWKPSFFSEIASFPRQVLQHHYPHVPLHGDFTTIQKGDYDPIELLVGGTPCQSFSVAGLRAGLDDPRGNLMLEFGALAKRLQPNWIVWENVPGVLSSNGGRDFGTFLGMLAELRYGFAYRVLDAQYFGVPQRRRRVFVVGHIGNWQRAAAVLFERHCLQGNPPPGRQTGQEIAGTFTKSTYDGGAGGKPDSAAVNHYIPSPSNHLTDSWPADTAGTLNAHFGSKLGLENQHIDGGASLFVPAYGIPGNWIGRAPENGGNQTEPFKDLSPCLTKTDVHAVAHAFKVRGGKEGGGKGYLGQDECAFTLSTNQDQHIAVPVDFRNMRYGDSDVSGTMQSKASGGYSLNYQTGIQQDMQVRRLTPMECERLQGFPDGYTKISDKTKDGPRYQALGNSMAVPVMHWIGQRIQIIESMKV